MRTQLQRQKWSLKPRVLRVKAPFILFHGGLGDARPELAKIFRKSLERIALELQQKLKRKSKSNAIDLAVMAAMELENDPVFNAGLGSRIQSDGVARLSSALMDGSQQKLAGVANIQAIKNPSLVAKALMKEPDRTLSSLEANLYAFQKGIRPETVITEKRWNEWEKQRGGKSGTIGAVAIDFKKKTAACTSTGGKGFEIPGRVSDSFTPAGNFANAFGAVSCTGTGEDILEAAAASSICTRLQDKMSLSEAVARSLKFSVKRDFGIISLSSKAEACVHAIDGPLSFGLVSADRILFGTEAADWNSYAPR